MFAETMHRARESDLRVALLRELSDVDTAADWERWLKHTSLNSNLSQAAVENT